MCVLAAQKRVGVFPFGLLWFTAREKKWEEVERFGRPDLYGKRIPSSELKNRWP